MAIQEPSPDRSDLPVFLCEELPDEFPMDLTPPISVDYLYGDEKIDRAPARFDNETIATDSVGNGFPISDPDKSCWSSLTNSFCPLSNMDSTTLQTFNPFVVGSGIKNIGNTCFMNSILQCFTHTVPLMEGLHSSKHQTPCDQCFTGFCVICTLRNHVRQSLSWPTRMSVSPRPFLENLNFFSSTFSKYEQEDAHEFLQCFLERLESCTSADENLVKKVFGGSLISKLECCNCGYLSETLEPLIDLSLEIEAVDSITDALGSFTKMEKIEEMESKYHCQNCKEEVDTVKQLLVDEAPSVAVFHLKRFKVHDSFTEKIEKHVEFPLEFDLQPYTVDFINDNIVGLKYDLYGVVVHNGSSLAFGHYYSFIRSSSDTWHLLNDEMVTPVSQEEVLSEKAYVLFYARRGTPWFSEFMNERKMTFFDIEPRTESPKSVLDTAQALSDMKPLGSVSHDVTDSVNKIECLNVDNCIVTPLGGSDKPQEAEKVIEDEVFHPLTPPRPQSPDFLPNFETPGSSHKIPLDHLKSEERPNRKRLLNKSGDEEKKEAVKYLTRSMPNSRASKLMEAIFGSQSKGGAAKKKRRMGSPCKRASPVNDRHKSTNHGSVSRPVAAVLR